MDLSLLYFLFPRLGESRRVLGRKVPFDDVTSSNVIELKQPLPIKRKRQYLRLVIDKDIGWRGFASGRADQLVSIVGIAKDAEGLSVRCPFRWVASGGPGIDFSSDTTLQFEKLEIACRVKGAYDFVWVCAGSDQK